MRNHTFLVFSLVASATMAWAFLVTHVARAGMHPLKYYETTIQPVK